uniref:Uncharacterized protein LOC114332006 n=1 Tax=Diabrotica virgifera virgifera TaxID=50390 RepID=A0A6P7FY66_DIAVI
MQLGTTNVKGTKKSSLPITRKYYWKWCHHGQASDNYSAVLSVKGITKYRTLAPVMQHTPNIHLHQCVPISSATIGYILVSIVMSRIATVITNAQPVGLISEENISLTCIRGIGPCPMDINTIYIITIKTSGDHEYWYTMGDNTFQIEKYP